MCKTIAQRNVEYTALRVSIAEALLLAMHDDLSEDGYIEQKDAYVRLLQKCVFPALGVDSELQQALDAWVHFRQYLQSGDDATLVQVRKCLKIQPDATSRNGGALPKKSNGGALAQAASQAVYCAMQKHLVTSLCDFFHEYTGAEQLAGVLDIAMFVASGMGRDELQTLMRFIMASLEHHLERLWAKASEEVAAEQAKDGDETAELDDSSVAKMLTAFAVSVQAR